mgnify:CR=1 FL=1
MCKTIINDRLKDLSWEKPNKNNDLGKDDGWISRKKSYT